MKPSLIQSIASSLIVSLVLNTFSWVPRALADETEGASEPRTTQLTYNFSMDIPNHGMIDLYHNAYSARDRISNSLYVLRNTAVEDLLNTRRGLKVLLGGTKRARQVSGNKNLSFDVPGGIVDLYMLGNLGSQYQTENVETSASGATPGSTPTTHGIDTDSIPEITQAIHWFGGSEPKVDPELRTRLLTGLVFISAQLAKFDQQLKFLQKDYWEIPAIRDEFRKINFIDWKREATLNTQVSLAMIGMLPGAPLMEEDARKLWLTRHGMNDVLAVLAGHREYLLDRYHLLGIELDGKPLYQLIYESMESMGFPRADTVMAPVTPHLPTGTDVIPMPLQFDEAVNAALDKMVAMQQNPLRPEANAALNKKVDQALLASLEANTERLTTLTNEINYDGSRSSPLLELARYGDLWSAAALKYEYLNGIIDFKGAQKEISSYFERVDTTKRRVRYSAYGVGIGIGIAAIVFSGGTALEGGAVVAEGAAATMTAATWLGIPLRAWMIGSGLITSTQATMDYVDSRQTAKVAKDMYLGTVSQGSHGDMKDSIQMADQDFKFMVASLMMLGWESRGVLLATGRAIVNVGGKTFVRISSEELGYLRQAVTELSKRAEAFAPLGRALLATVRSLLGMVAGADTVMAFEQAIPIVARQMRLAPAVVMTRLETSPLLGTLIKGCRLRGETARLMARPSFLRTMIEQQVISATVSVAAEYAERGNKMWGSEFSDFATDMAIGVGITFSLVYIGTPSAVAKVTGATNAAAAAGAASRVHVDGGFFNNNAFGQFLKDSARMGKQNFLVGVGFTGGTTALRESIEYVRTRNDPNAPSGMSRVLTTVSLATYGGLMMGVSSNLRYQGYTWLQNNISRYIESKPTAKIILAAASAGNNFFGGWHYVKVGKMIGVMHEGAETDESLDSSITGVQVEDMGSAYYRVQGDSAAADYMFDFLRGGEQAGPAPVPN